MTTKSKTRTNPALGRRPFAIRLGTVGVAFIASLGMPVPPGVGSVAVSDVSAQWPRGQFRIEIWNFQICIASCMPGHGFCCDESPGPLL